MSFQQLNIHPSILGALEEKGYTQPTPIQQQAIPAMLSGRDVLASAQTGTGKTASFSIPLLQLLSAQKGLGGIRGLVLTPTRELAIQVSENLTQYGKHLSLRSVLVYGGVPQTQQVNQIKRGADIVIATPGRLMDLIQQRVISLSNLQILVLDEADRMLDMGFIRDVQKILALVPAPCQKVFLSATIPNEIQELVGKMLRSPIRIAITPEKTTAVIQQGVYHVARQNKRALLKHVIADQQMRNVLVFARTKHGADKIARDLIKSGISAEAFHGNKSQGARQRTLANFKQNVTRVLVATDIAARGIDINDLPFVINYEMPDTVETYTHRIGRTGRAGNAGTALSFCDYEEQAQLKSLNRISPGKIEALKHPFMN
ncbi:MAG: DEAD/DEAH box helicase [Bacteroidota bacterium]|jgi:ATP-dependent RNA helicase RhlE|nr:DEAD/DEAH box helicase [Cytophagales bacterium]MCE2957209.1 DEAD/DEAH box helicase [Flammeovirgaceae bacterium]MCZ8070342.1 DEAD/DEAH box helicase [Cytophagales bacterium]